MSLGADEGVIPTFPPAGGNGYDRFTETVTLSGAQYVLTWTWMARLCAWYVDLASIDGTAIVTGRRVSPGWFPWLGLRSAALPAGTLAIYGPDPYAENDLGQTVLPFYLTSAPSVATNPYGLRVVL